MSDTQDDCRRAFERWYNDFPVGGRAAKEGLAWTVWQAAWSSRPQPNVEELVRRIQLRIETTKMRTRDCTDLRVLLSLEGQKG